MRRSLVSVGLTPREQEVAFLVLDGKTNRVIAGELNISENTVTSHVRNLLSKFGVNNRKELMALLFKAHAGWRNGE